MFIILLRTIFIISSVIFTSLFYIHYSIKAVIISGGLAAAASLAVVVMIEYISHSFQPRQLIAALTGLLTGLFAGHMLVQGIDSIQLQFIVQYAGIIKPLLYHLCGFAIMMFFIINQEELTFLDKIISERGKESDVQIAYKILDTSVIIDGRIADICDTGFLEGMKCNVIISPPTIMCFRRRRRRLINAAAAAFSRR